MGKVSPTRGAWCALVFGVLMVSLLSGCLSDDPGPIPGTPVGHDLPSDDVRSPDGRDLRTELTAGDELPQPKWAVGDWWGIQIDYGSQGNYQRSMDLIVTEATANGYHLATDDAQMAKEHAAFEFPMLGPIGTDLGMSGQGSWQWFSFPLTDGATWAGEMPNIAFDILPPGQVSIRFTATFTDALEVDGKKVPGYTVHGETEDGTLLVEYDYAPSVRWITRAVVYDIDPGQDPLEFTVMLVAHGRGWAGTYYIDEARPLIENIDGSGLTAPPPDGEPFAETSPHATFIVSADATYLFGWIQMAAVLGLRETLLIPPEGETWHYEATGAVEEWYGMYLDEAAIAGEWHLLTTGAGAFSYSHIWLVEIIETSGTL